MRTRGRPEVSGWPQPEPGHLRPAASLPQLHRRAGGRIIGGVAGGLADHLGVDPFRVRVVFVVLSALAGAGAVAYGLLWFVTPAGTDTDAPRRAERTQAYGLAAVGIAAVLVVGLVGGGTPIRYLVPLVVVAIGVTVVWREVDPAPNTADSPGSNSSGPSRTSRLLTLTRVVGGGALVIAGLVVAVLATGGSTSGLDTTILAVLATLFGVVLLTVPVWTRLLRTVDAERSARIRADERDAIAAHLHDSVLQTLALIQRQSHHPDEVVRLARGQERELRDWLFGETAHAASSLAAAMKAVAAAVEDSFAIEVNVVTVGDLTWPDDSPRWSALVGAVREALINAAKHSGQRRVDLYSEVAPEHVEVFVRDRGAGFDPDAVPQDRHGIARSIRGRVQRHGGTVTIRSSPESGTEVALHIPRTSSPEAAS
ncbi:ATP-binding protein [Williamsia sp. CHRR-6]|uniref:ATP-binding protein n=1 Tax=Williamsia sp. CHRR-6 TaxID=2835871 RepID=UPI001BD94464|nr:ATP-binding protein [Williamsia sp. CHRR-6]MBT0566771.1 PspC domain-containing protein [Williamsia sp. CHRR-6]